MVNPSESQSSDPKFFSGRGEYDFLFNVDDIVCYFCSLESSNCLQVGSGDLGQKVLFMTG